MSSQYHFSFLLTKITIYDLPQDSPPPQCCFKFELLRCLGQHNVLYRSTPSIYGRLNEVGELRIQGEQMRLSLSRGDLRECETFELRLIRLLSLGAGQQLVGCYQFVLNHYINVHDQHNRGCIEINIQLTDTTVMSYLVFVESTTNALEEMINQHLANQATKQRSNSEVDFAPSELYNPRRQKNYRKIQLEKSEDEFTLNQQIYSPKIQKKSIRDSKGTADTNIMGELLHVEESQSVTSRPRRKSFSKIKKSQALFRSTKIFNEQENAPKLSRWNSGIRTESEDESEAMNEVYQQIGKNSKILLPGANNDYELYKEPRGDSRIKAHSEQVVTLSMRKSRINLLLVLLSILLLILVVWMAKENWPQSGKRGKKSKRKRRVR